MLQVAQLGLKWWKHLCVNAKIAWRSDWATNAAGLHPFKQGNNSRSARQSRGTGFSRFCQPIFIWDSAFPHLQCRHDCQEDRADREDKFGNGNLFGIN